MSCPALDAYRLRAYCVSLWFGDAFTPINCGSFSHLWDVQAGQNAFELCTDMTTFCAPALYYRAKDFCHSARRHYRLLLKTSIPSTAALHPSSSVPAITTCQPATSTHYAILSMPLLYLPLYHSSSLLIHTFLPCPTATYTTHMPRAPLLAPSRFPVPRAAVRGSQRMPHLAHLLSHPTTVPTYLLTPPPRSRGLFSALPLRKLPRAPLNPRSATTYTTQPLFCRWLFPYSPLRRTILASIKHENIFRFGGEGDRTDILLRFALLRVCGRRDNVWAAFIL